MRVCVYRDECMHVYTNACVCTVLKKINVPHGRFERFPIEQDQTRFFLNSVCFGTMRPIPKAWFFWKSKMHYRYLNLRLELGLVTVLRNTVIMVTMYDGT